MEVYITQGASETAVEIHCTEADDRIGKLKKYTEAYGLTLSGKAGSEILIVAVNDILYFESVDGRTFIYTRDSVLETDRKLYELEEWLDRGDFYRCSKSCILNINIRNIAVFCSSAMLLPLSFVTSKILGISFSDKENPLSKPGVLFTMNQMLYLTIVMWACSANPESMVMIYAIVFAAQLLPFGWLYRSKAYSVMSVVGTVAALFSGILADAADTAFVMIICELILTVWLVTENRKQ